MSEVKLLPCPFCGSNGNIETINSHAGARYSVKCWECSCGTPYQADLNQVVEVWNTRAPEADTERIRNDALEEAANKCTHYEHWCDDCMSECHESDAREIRMLKSKAHT